jgi:hypothetical protein
MGKKYVTAISATVLGFFDIPKGMNWEEAQEWVLSIASRDSFTMVEIEIEDDISQDEDY